MEKPKMLACFYKTIFTQIKNVKWKISNFFSFLNLFQERGSSSSVQKALQIWRNSHGCTWRMFKDCDMLTQLGINLHFFSDSCSLAFFQCQVELNDSSIIQESTMCFSFRSLSLAFGLFALSVEMRVEESGVWWDFCHQGVGNLQYPGFCNIPGCFRLFSLWDISSFPT